MLTFTAEMQSALLACLIGFGPGMVIGVVIWLAARRSAPMPLYYADLISFFAPLIVWAVMNKYDLTLVKTPHELDHEGMILGWVWSISFICRLLIPRFTHKLRFRLAAIHVGSIGVLAAILLSLFFKGLPF